MENPENNTGMEPLASELYKDLKEANKFKEKVIFALLGGIALLILAMSGMHFYHIYQWSQFDTVVVDSDGSGHANYVQGDNTGGIYNGEGNGTPSEEGNN